MDKVEIYADGACKGNPGTGGWGALMVADGAKKEIYGGELNTTNNRMELKAVIEGPIVAERDPADADFLAAAARAAESLDWAGDPWHALTATLKADTGRSGKALFLPLRRALTGREHGPDMKALLPLIGRHRAIARLSPE